MNRILILGASGFIGKELYKELYPYFDVYGTFCHQKDSYEQNQVFYKYDVEKDSIERILNKIAPTHIISALRGDFKAQYNAHKEINQYILKNDTCSLYYLSSVNVFDGNYKFPSYEKDTPISQSDYGRHKISIEKLIAELPERSYTILRLPMVLGVNSPRMAQLKQAIKCSAEFEVYPNLIISITTANKIAQQVHYIINKHKTGIYHLSSNDVIHHEDLFKELTEKLSDAKPIYKRVYSRNEDSYLALLPKGKLLPQEYQVTVAQVIEDSTLHEEINLFKN